LELVHLVILVALIEYIFFGLKSGQARGKAGLTAPAMTGDPVFERSVRVHQNTLEQLIVFLPAIWIFAATVDALAAAILGVVFIVGRFLYWKGYVEDPAKRGTGFLVGFVANAILVLGAIVGSLFALAA